MVLQITGPYNVLFKFLFMFFCLCWWKGAIIQRYGICSRFDTWPLQLKRLRKTFDGCCQPEKTILGLDQPRLWLGSFSCSVTQRTGAKWDVCSPPSCAHCFPNLLMLLSSRHNWQHSTVIPLSLLGAEKHHCDLAMHMDVCIYIWTTSVHSYGMSEMNICVLDSRLGLWTFWRHYNVN